MKREQILATLRAAPKPQYVIGEEAKFGATPYFVTGIRLRFEEVGGVRKHSVKPGEWEYLLAYVEYGWVWETGWIKESKLTKYPES